MSVEAPAKLKPKGMLAMDIEAGMDESLRHAAVENSTTIMSRPPKEQQTPPPIVKKDEPHKGLLENLESASEPPVEPPKKVTPTESIAILKSKREAAEKEAADLRVELEKTRKNQTDADGYKTRAEQAEQELAKAAVERSPAFRRQFIDKPKELIEQAKGLAKELEVPENIVDQASALHGKERREFIDSNFSSPSAVSEITGILHAVDDLIKQRNSELDNHKAALEKYEKQQQESLAQQGIQTREAYLQKFESKLPEVAERVGAPFKKTGEAAHDSQVDENLKLARSLADGTANEDDMAVVPYLAVAALSQMRHNKVLAAEVEKLRARLKAYGDVEPSGSHADSANERQQSNGGKPKGIMARANEDFGRR